MYVYFISQQENDFTTKNDNNKLFKKSIGLNTNSKQRDHVPRSSKHTLPTDRTRHILIIIIKTVETVVSPVNTKWSHKLTQIDEQ